jgi:hypothetical protein
MKRLNLMIDDETLALLKELAAAEHETVSNYLRRLIRAQSVFQPQSPDASAVALDRRRPSKPA